MKSFKDSMENISSKSKDFKLKDPVDLYGKFLFNNLGKTVKFIAYLVAAITLLAGIVAVLFIAKSNVGFLVLGCAILLALAVLAFIEFFIIYGIGHIIDQNNEILKRL